MKHQNHSKTIPTSRKVGNHHVKTAPDKAAPLALGLPPSPRGCGGTSRRAGLPAPARSSFAKHNIFIVDDHPLVCEAISGLINQQKDMVVCGTAGEYRVALQAISTARPEIVVVDISLGGKSGIDLIKDLKAVYPKILAIVFSMHDEALYAARALQAGAMGYIMKSEPPEKIVEGIRQMLVGKIVLSEPMREHLVTQLVGGKAATAIVSPLESLSDRELTVFELIGQGLGSSQIARKISLSIHTVQSYRERIKEKLNLHHAVELIQHAVQWVQSGKRLK